MIHSKAHSEIGTGIYSIPDISLLLRLPKPKVRRWLADFWDTRFGEKYNNNYSWGTGINKATNFYTLIEFYVFYQLRELKVGTKAIFTAHDEMSRQLKTPYPFASAKVLTDGRKILYTLTDGTTINADKSHQINLKEVIEAFCKKIEFSDNDLAEKYWPLGKKEQIVVDPHHQFGQPIIDQTNILAESIFNLYQAGETIDFLSRLYDIKERDIKAAISLFNQKAA